MKSIKVPHSIMLAPYLDIPLFSAIAKHGEGFLIIYGLKDGKAFRGESAERVEGIDYSAFKIHSVRVGAMLQFHNVFAPSNPPWPAEDLFKPWDKPLNVMMEGVDLTIALRNVSDEPQRFAVKINGLLLS